ncbi:hypothetical protein PSU4_41530 [Pseudonocardia sulfidoxydans NBRC 16205]|uniref:SnoaL-like domain-containing protein n=1 Tax=Pseudonocardia sulfidoxydans NBRC 16205 TaxID=1223511 RepID=A0A511DK56_9PSEU|nr:nuclear transport factor 2 family protein [Pseudonocardia sulfidoxydans]GEL25199.1 hypothetical protein PSU4_41530 [Pseudonocardia sulfidoxydans NBRC 16205]
MTSPALASGLLTDDGHAVDQLAPPSVLEAVRSLLLAERSAKDFGDWDVMARAYAPQARVRVSWFDGTATEFVAGARARADRALVRSFHELGPVSVVVAGSRALADASCAVHLRGLLGGVEVDVVSRGILRWRVVHAGCAWRIRSMDMIYIRDSLSPVVAGTAVPTPPGAAGAHPHEGARSSYRFLQQLLTAAGHGVPDDLPGLDRPDLVEPILTGHRRWLTTAEDSRDG